MPLRADKVFGVIVAELFRPLAEELVTMARKAAVLGDGGGKLVGPPTSGVRPVFGVRPVPGVRPVRRVVGS